MNVAAIIVFLLLCCAAAFGASSSLRISQLINFEAGSNGEVINDADSDTNTWNSMIQSNAKGGFERYTLGGSGNMTIDTGLQVDLLRPITLTSGTTYYETNSTRSVKMDDAATQAEYLRYWFNGGAKNKVSWGYFIKMNSWTQDGNSYDMIFGDGNSGDFAGLQFYNDASQFTAALETGAGVSGTAVMQKNKTYWVTCLWDAANTIARQRIYDPVTWLQVTNEQTKAIANTACRFLAIGRYDAHQHAPSGSLHWFDNIVIDDTGANYPMFPASAWVADSTGRTDVNTVYTSASDNESIVLPAGSNTWTSAITLNKTGLNISGVSTNTTWITNAGSGIQDYLFIAKSNSITFTNIAFAGTNSGLVSGAFYTRAIQLDGLYVTVGWCLFKFFDTALIHQAPGTVTYRSMFLDNRIFGRCFGDGDGSANWTAYGPASSLNYCTTNFSFLEDCIVDQSPSMPADVSVGFSSQQGQLWVVRHCQFTFRSSWDYSPVFDFHGPTSGGPLRGGIGCILASNYLNFSGSGASFDRLIDVRGGSSLVYSNVVTNYVDSAGINMRRDDDDAALYFQNSGVEQVTNCWYWANTQNGSAMPISTEANDTSVIVGGLSWTNVQPAFCVVPTYPMPLRADAGAQASVGTPPTPTTIRLRGLRLTR